MKLSKLVRELSLVAVGVVGLASSGTLWAGAPSPMIRARGTIQNVDRTYETFTMKNRYNALLGIEWNHQTRFYENGKPTVSTELKPGEQVIVSYEKEGETLRARTVSVLPLNPAALGHARSVS